MIILISSIVFCFLILTILEVKADVDYGNKKKTEEKEKNNKIDELFNEVKSITEIVKNDNLMNLINENNLKIKELKENFESNNKNIIEALTKFKEYLVNISARINELVDSQLKSSQNTNANNKQTIDSIESFKADLKKDIETLINNYNDNINSNIESLINNCVNNINRLKKKKLNIKKIMI